MKTTLLALVVALAACGAPATSTLQPALTGANQTTTSTTAKNAHKATSAAQTAAVDPTTALGTGGASAEDADESAAPPRSVNGAGEHGGYHPESPRPANTGDPCGWCRSQR